MPIVSENIEQIAKGQLNGGAKMGTLPKPKKQSKVIELFKKKEFTAKFPIEVFPPRLRAIFEEAYKKGNLPKEFTASTCITLCSALIGSSLKVDMNGDWLEPASLWLALVAPPSTLKTPSIKFASSGVLRKVIMNNQDEYRQSLQNWKEHCQNLQEGEEMPRKPREKIFKIGDSTMESIFEKMENNPKGLFMMEDELAGWLKRFNQYRAGSDKESYLKIFNTVDLDIGRKGSNVRIENPCMPILGGIQPEKLREMAGKDSVNDGFWVRMLFAFPESMDKKAINLRNRFSQSDKRAYEEIMMKIQTHLPYPFYLPVDAIDGEKEERFDHEKYGKVRMTDEGIDAWEDWANGRNKDLINNTDDPILRALYGKLEAYSIRFALNLKVLHWASESKDGREYPMWLNAADVQKGIDMTEYFRSSAIHVHYLQRYEAVPDEVLKAAEMFAAGEAQIDIAKKLNVSQNKISRWKREAFKDIFNEAKRYRGLI